MSDLGKRVGDALLRAPYAWLTATLAVLFILTTSLSGIAEEPGHGSTVLAVAAAAFALIDGAIAFLVVPRTVLAQVRREGSEGQVAIMRWAFSMAPFLVTYAAVAAGAERWTLSVGLFVSVVLLIQWARAAHRAGPA